VLEGLFSPFLSRSPPPSFSTAALVSPPPQFDSFPNVLRMLSPDPAALYLILFRPEPRFSSRARLPFSPLYHPRLRRLRISLRPRLSWAIAPRLLPEKNSEMNVEGKPLPFRLLPPESSKCPFYPLASLPVVAVRSSGLVVPSKFF